MATNPEKVEAQALKLPLRERAALAEHLIASLDDLDDTEIERLWVEEAERRYREYKKGRISARPAEDVFRDAYRRIR
ncbi:MAG: addiction module protein [Planctomycetes bacterium]|nr:addiction module protein [Planctomycetota bacterium]MBM4081003.1 addiction module protein [Planctomycetota bacterium]MBM4086064.1 addiction module protein [Planctomycetota bacterium]